MWVKQAALHRVPRAAALRGDRRGAGRRSQGANDAARLCVADATGSFGTTKIVVKLVGVGVVVALDPTLQLVQLRLDLVCKILAH